MQQIRSFGVLQTSKLVGCLYLALGAAIVVIAIPVVLVVTTLAPATQDSRKIWLALLPILLMIPLYGLVGFVFTAIVCWLYNLVARKIGGIEVEILPSAVISQAENLPPQG